MIWPIRLIWIVTRRFIFLLRDNYQGLEPKDNMSKHNLLYSEKNKRYIHKKLDLRTVVLIDNESTLDLFCNQDSVKNIKNIKGPLRIHSNGGEISVNQKAKIPWYNKRVCFSRRAITNILALKNLTEQYIVTYDRNDHLFVVHREGLGLPNMKFLMHYSGLYYYELPKKDLVFLNTVC